MRIPDTYSPRPVPRARTQAVRIRNDQVANATGNLAEAVGGISRDLNRVATEFDLKRQEEEAAQAATADVNVSNQIREILYAPETGYLGLQQDNAVSGYEVTKQQLEGLTEKALADLPQSVRTRLGPALARRVDGALQKMAVHRKQERTRWLDGAAEARLASTADDTLAAYSNEAEVNEYINIGVGEIRNRAQRQGWSSDQRVATEEAYVSARLRSVVFRRAQDDPSAALAYAERNADRFTAADMADIQSTIGKESKIQQGREWARNGGSNAATVTGAYNRTFVSADGHSPDLKNVKPDVMDKFARLQGELGRVIPLNSGFRDPQRNARAGGAEQKRDANGKVIPGTGSQHIHGNAIDIDVSDMSNRERLELIEKASALGFTGIGVYNTAIHLDTAGRRFWGPSYKAKSAPAWAKRTLQMHMQGAFAQTPSDDGGQSGNRFDAAMEISDPVVRDAAIAELARMQQFENAEKARTKREAQDGIWAFVEAGNDPGDAPAEMRLAAGQGAVSAAESYWLAKETGQPIKTDPEAYLALRAMGTEEFLATDMREYRDRLSETDWKRMVDQQASAKGGGFSERSMEATLGPARRVFESMGIFGGAAGSKQARELARLEAEVLMQADQWAMDNPGQEMSRPQIMQIAKRVGGTFNAPAEIDDVRLAPSSLRSAAQPITRSALGSPAKNADKYAEFEPAHLDAARKFRAQMGRDPSSAESQDMARDMLVEFHIDGGGIAGLFSGENKYAYQITGDDLTDLQRGRSVIEYDGRKITIDEIQGAVKAFKAANGYEPQIYQIMAMVTR